MSGRHFQNNRRALAEKNQAGDERKRAIWTCSEKLIRANAFKKWLKYPDTTSANACSVATQEIVKRSQMT
jgi:hypothetical protein